jgi:pyridoxal biosynthesis lyase PdxS
MNVHFFEVPFWIKISPLNEAINEKEEGWTKIRSFCDQGAGRMSPRNRSLRINERGLTVALRSLNEPRQPPGRLILCGPISSPRPDVRG